MKKVLTAILVLVLVLSLSFSVLAAPANFISSPSTEEAPGLVSGTNVSEDCVAQLIITAYAERDELPAEIRALLEEAYKMITEAGDLSELNAKVKEIAEKMGLDMKDLAVSHLFDISTTDCDGHADHGHFDVTLSADTLHNFVCLLHYYNGEWRIVENAQVTNNGEHLEFDEDEFSPFAIVVSTDTPDTGDNMDIVLFAALMVLSGAAVVFFWMKSRKENN
ncbi:MAG: LPXTG cell wall anchor domain-containing protein [Clostridia bacterium]|nr:LPXTG cell wall anchor domain-containing protein [Clostridia bacterium]